MSQGTKKRIHSFKFWSNSLELQHWIHISHPKSQSGTFQSLTFQSGNHVRGINSIGTRAIIIAYDDENKTSSVKKKMLNKRKLL